MVNTKWIILLTILRNFNVVQDRKINMVHILLQKDDEIDNRPVR